MLVFVKQAGKFRYRIKYDYQRICFSEVVRAAHFNLIFQAKVSI